MKLTKGGINSDESVDLSKYFEASFTAHRLAEDGDPRRINKFLLSEVAPRRVGVKGLFRVPIAATAAGDAARPQAVDRQRHIALRTKPIGDPD